MVSETKPLNSLNQSKKVKHINQHEITIESPLNHHEITLKSPSFLQNGLRSAGLGRQGDGDLPRGCWFRAGKLVDSDGKCLWYITHTIRMYGISGLPFTINKNPQC